MNTTARFWDRIADNYAKKPVPDQRIYEKKLQITRQYFRPDWTVLEFGCGTGSTALAHAPFVKQIMGTDISSRMIEIARGKAKAQGIDNVSFEQSSIEALTLPEQSVDAVLGLSILHLLENKEEVIARVQRMLKPGGIFVTGTACLGDRMAYFKFLAPVGKFFGLMPQVKVFSAKQLEQCIRDAGFSIDYRWRPDTHTVFIVAKK